jgi:hypothetical protein
MDDWRGIYRVIDLLDVFDVRPVIDEAGEREDAEVKEGVNFLIFARMVSIFFVKSVRGMSGSARTLAG